MSVHSTAAGTAEAPIAILAGQRFVVDPAGDTAAATTLAIAIGQRVLADPAGETFAAAGWTGLHGAAISLLPVAVVVLALGPAGIGAVHIAAPDLWYEIPEGLWYSALPPGRLHYTLR